MKCKKYIEKILTRDDGYVILIQWCVLNTVQSTLYPDKIQRFFIHMLKC